MRAVLSDFDGTITKADVAELILQRFTGDAWLPIEAEHRGRPWRAGREEMLDFVPFESFDDVLREMSPWS